MPTEEEPAKKYEKKKVHARGRADLNDCPGQVRAKTEGKKQLFCGETLLMFKELYRFAPGLLS